MSGRVFSRPRTRVYNSNYAVGESYYKSALDNLDRKYGRSSAPPSEAPTATNGSLRASLEKDFTLPTRRPVLLDDEDLDIPRRKPKTASLQGEFDSIFEKRMKNGTKERTPPRSLKKYEDDIDEEFAESMKRIKSARANRAAAEDMEEIESSLSSRKKDVRSQKLNFSSKMIDSVGVEEKSVRAGRKVLSVVASPDDSEDFTRWTAVKSGRRHVLDDDDTEDSASQIAASARARKSKARLDDLEAEMSALEERGAAREKRLRDLRALLSENEASTQENLHSTVRVKSTVKTEKKIVSF